MNNFFNWLKEFFSRFIQDLGMFFSNWIVYKWTFVGGNFTYYNDLFGTYSPSFGPGGWILFVVFILLVMAALCGIGYLLFIVLRKYIRFVKKELDKDDLLHQVEQLNNELYQAVSEKEKILNLKVAEMGIKPELKPDANLPQEDKEKEAQKTLKEISSRFSRLVQVDNKYAEAKTDIPDVQGLTLEELVQRFRNFAASSLGLYYTIPDMRALFASMGTSKIIILEGISGTGKTSLPYALGKFFVNDAVICSVQPSWRDRTELMGYYNEFTKKFSETDFLRAVYEATYRKDPNLIVLDEMNLARIEYYFAEFLSIMEMPNVNEWKIQLISASQPTDPDHLIDGKLLISQNTWFFGTANNDDSTFTITDKVYDRAMSIYFNDKGRPFDCEYQDSLVVPYSQLNDLFKQAIINNPISKVTLDKFSKLDDFTMKNFKLVFGNRIMKQLSSFLPIYVACGGSEVEGLDHFFCTKILKKFQSLNIGFLKDELKSMISELDKLYGKANFKQSKAFIENLIKMN